MPWGPPPPALPEAHPLTLKRLRAAGAAGLWGSTEKSTERKWDVYAPFWLKNRDGGTPGSEFPS